MGRKKDLLTTSQFAHFTSPLLLLPRINQRPSQNFRNRPRCFILGDFNLKHKSWNPTGNGQEELSSSISRETVVSLSLYISAPAQPTRITHHHNARPSVIDFAMSSGLSNITAETMFDLSSDHNPVLYTFTPDFNFSYSHNCTTFTNWNKFQLLLHSSVPGNPSINNEDDIDFAVSNLTEKIHASINQSSITKHIKHQITFIPLSTRMKFREKNRLRKLWQFCRYPPLKAELNKLQKAIRMELKTHKEHLWDEILSDANIDPNAIHKLIARKRKPVILPPLLGYHGLIYNIQDKANLFMEVLEELFKENSSSYDDDHIDLVEREVH
ncbi:RNA-directed DNA polymerase from mobile element jockey [Trichonephila clavata]|uniref:RNA-directed DNA polymerase from mobile element jockey n=1 Tax=Trichonephila clavata TaxID=2740835 RepID=A0A8X6HZD1_TRICU|nr:RNA-directed DNA polymerase from mobile element jockey [Trichonephila clavata]